MKRIGIIALWLVLAASLFAVMSTSKSGVKFATGANSYSFYGWPDAWLTRNQFQTFVVDGNGPLVQDEYWVKWSVSSWASLLVAVLIALGVSGCLLGIPMAFIRKKGLVNKS
jgi:hypothetical protein